MQLFFYKEKSLTIKQSCYQAKNTAIPYGTLHCHIKLSGLGLLREQNKPVEQAEAIMNDYVSSLNKIETSKNCQRKPPLPYQ
jgi:hypothetical protein